MLDALLHVQIRVTQHTVPLPAPLFDSLAILTIVALAAAALFVTVRPVVAAVAVADAKCRWWLVGH